MCAGVRAARSMKRYLDRIQELMRPESTFKARIDHFYSKEWRRPRRAL